MAASLLAQNTTGCNPGQPNVNLGDCVALNETQSVGGVYNQPADLVNLVTRNIFIVAGIVIFFMILLAGYRYIEQGEKGAEQAKTIAGTALIGLIIMFCAYWAVRLLEIVLGQNLIF